MHCTSFVSAAALLHALLFGEVVADAPGEAGTEAQKLIVGGVEVEKGRYPYQVSLVHRCGFIGHICGGSLVDKDWVLSAAHCAGMAHKVQIGRHDLDDEGEDFEEIEVDWETLHPDWDCNTFDNDFMMVKLKKSSNYSPITLDDGSADLADGVDVTTMGWGTTESGGDPSDVLLEVEVDVVNNTTCAEEYIDDLISENMICAGREGKDSCQGDSGGPLFIKGATADDDVQVGVVSWGYGCADPEYSGVYSKVAAKVDWINEQILSGTDPCRLRPLLLKFLSKDSSGRRLLRH